MYEFKDDSPVDITHNAETVTLRYKEDHGDLASIRVDRADVPAGGQVHVAISDVQLNLNPTEDDIWYMWANGTTTYGDADPEAIDRQDIFRGDTGRLAINNLDPITIEYDADDGAMVEFEETGPSTGVFVSYDTNEESRITVNGDARAGSTFTVDYAGNDAQVIVDDFDFAMELVRDGIGSTWDSGEDLTVRLSAEGLNLNTLKDDDMTIADDDLPVLILGEPITLATVGSIARGWRGGIWRDVVCQSRYPCGHVEGNKYHHHVYHNADRISNNGTAQGQRRTEPLCPLLKRVCCHHRCPTRRPDGTIAIANGMDGNRRGRWRRRQVQRNVYRTRVGVYLEQHRTEHGSCRAP